MAACLDFSCPRCGGPARVRATYRLPDGTQKRAMHCKWHDCAHRYWLLPGTDSSDLIHRDFSPSHSCPQCGSAGYVVDSRRNADGTKRRRLRCSSLECQHRWTFWGDLQPAPRSRKEGRKRRTCLSCVHWSKASSSCSMGHPDVQEEGIGFAAECVTYLTVRKTT